VVRDLKPIYTAINADQAQLELDAFDAKWGQQLPVIGQAWRQLGVRDPVHGVRTRSPAGDLHDG
jgi:hypothetical protein